MCICDLQYSYCVYPARIQGTIFPCWQGIIGRFKYQPQRMLQVSTPLT